MNALPQMVSEAPGWDYDARLEGRCRHCGADLSGVAHVRATVEWVNRYHSDEAFHRGVNQGIARIAMRRHERECTGAPVESPHDAGWALPPVERQGLTRTQSRPVGRPVERTLTTGVRW